MTDIKKNIAKNIIELRKSKKMTQAELAEHLNYTDKAISKWERGESTPDVDALDKIASLFNVDVDYLFRETHKEKEKYIKSSKNRLINNLLVLLLFCVGVYLIGTCVFVGMLIKHPTDHKGAWISFVYCVPFCCIFVINFFRKIRNKLGLIISLSTFLWSLILSVYLHLLISDSVDLWIIFFIGIPLEAALIIIIFLLEHKQ